jgi:hypothetical protein
MEPSSRNRWQPVANRKPRETAQTSENHCRGLRSSPEEGTAKFLQIGSQKRVAKRRSDLLDGGYQLPLKVTRPLFFSSRVEDACTRPGRRRGPRRGSRPEPRSLFLL